jgi:phage terminase large subunit GpA-like protein
MISVLDDLQSSGLEAIDTHWRPNVVIQDKRTPSQWAIDERYIGRGASPLSKNGDLKYNFDICPWAREPSDTPLDRTVQVMVMQWASSMMKTDGVGSNIIGWSMREDPVNIQVTFPTREMRDKYSRDVIDAGLLASTKTLRQLIPEKKSREAGNTISYKKFPGGSITMVAAGTGAGIRGPRVGCSWNAEVDLMKGAIGNEGDPLLLALKRCEGFPDAIKVIEGTPTIRHHSRVESWLQLSDKRMWFCPCRKCGQYQIMLWSRHNNFYLTKTLPPHAFIEWPRTGKSRLEKAVLICGTCGATHNDPQRYQMALNGRWQPTADFHGIRGYWLNGIGTTLPPEKGFVNKLHQMAAIADLHRRAGREGLRVWVNTFLAETFQEEQDVKTQWATLFERREEYPVLTK